MLTAVFTGKMFTATFAPTVGNLERLAALAPSLHEAGCASRITLEGGLAVVRLYGDEAALRRGGRLLSTVD
jgi:hypothetical protein